MSLRPASLLILLLAVAAADIAAACDEPAPTLDCLRQDPALVESWRIADTYHLALATSLSRKNTVDALIAAAATVSWMEGDSFVPRTMVVPPELASAALLARASALAPDDPRPWYVAATLGPCADDAPCPADAALARLALLDADNAATWLLAFERATRRDDAPGARAALARAARAPAYHDRVDELERAMLRELLDDATVIAFDPAKARTTLAPAQFVRWFKLNDSSVAFMGVTGGYELTQACAPGAAKTDDELRADCIAIARAMDNAGASVIAQAHGRFLQARLATDAAERERLEHRRDEIKWLLEASRSPVDADVDPAQMEQEIAQRLAGIGEVERLRRAVAAKGLAFPPDWHPARDAEASHDARERH